MKRAFLRRLGCRLFGHEWHPVYEGTPSSCLYCLRCHENGWRL